MHSHTFISFIIKQLLYLRYNSLSLGIDAHAPILNEFKTQTQYLSLSIDAYNSRRGLVRCCDEDGVSTDPIHVNACPGLHVVHVKVSVLCNHKYNVVFWADLK